MKKLITIYLLLATTFTVNAQNSKQIIGIWEIKKISLENIEIADDEDNADKKYADLFEKAMLKMVPKGYKLTETDKKIAKYTAIDLADSTNESVIFFKEKNIFEKSYEDYKMPITSSGEYIIAENNLKITIKDSEENYEIIKINATDLIIKKINIKVFYYYSKVKEE